MSEVPLYSLGSGKHVVRKLPLFMFSGRVVERTGSWMGPPHGKRAPRAWIHGGGNTL